jgi:glycosyltransferase involved in cell wall biosynthesis
MISFIIPAHNEELLLGRTLAALHAAARACGQAYEVIVVDDASTDRTAQIAAEAGARVATVSLRQISAVRNAGARLASGDVLIFVDADTVVPEATLRAALDALRDGAVGGGAGAAFDGPIPLYARVLLVFFVWMFRVFRFAAGCFVFCTRKAFDAGGGWDETLFASEELYMSLALRRQGRFVVLRQRVITSGRKLRTHSAREILWVLFWGGLRGRRALCRREGLEVWYAPRRPDPHQPG